MSTTNPDWIKGQFPNRLKQIRKANYFLQAQLIELCEGLANKDPDTFTTISASTISHLENGYVKPKPRTARTLAEALNKAIDVIFPLGAEDMIHNPTGISGRKS